MLVRVASGERGIILPDVLSWPVVGRFLRWRHARTALQLILLLLAAVVVIDGLFSTRNDPTRLSTVLTWVHYRGLLVIALLAAGNLFCAGCPFVLVRDAARRIKAPGRAVPTWLRTKWVAIGLFVAVLFCYELFDLWALPRATAYLVLGYFAAAVLVDTVFTGATFCKYLCPIGQFNFVSSTMSPLELRVKEPATCASCRTADCIKCRRAPGDPALVLARGCELRLFLPSKVGNMDCTLCLDCVHACPSDNIALAPRVPGAELADGRRRSGIGRFSRRWDIAALAVVFTFGALLNAFGMVAPASTVEARIARALGAASEAPVLGLLYVAGLVVAPVVLLGGAASVVRVSGADRGRTLAQIAVNFAYSLVPLGFGMWLAHYTFHLATGAMVVVPVTQRALADAFGRFVLGPPLWQLTGLRPGAVFPIQMGLLLVGGMGSVAAAFRIAERDYGPQAGRALAPWALVIGMVAVTAFWILLQPMEMRGVGFAG
jgi:hypothetical protein